ncbi:MAG: class I tRNA ligase family protein, partial [Patescibacteria group bacterium]|nr:class I tRNA ligase family protein [Patescibacteria group bacterium]
MVDTKPEQNRPKSKLAESEERILQFWKEREIFKKTLEKPSPRGEFVFYEGPPTANGRPGIHHMEARAFKDAIPRYKTMRGYHVRRKGGWDTHGLPVELEVEKAHGFKSKKDIEAYGIEKFNRECKENVWKYVDEWERFTERTGYWVDEKDPYVTYESSYIESVWNVLATAAKQDLLYKDYRVVPWCPRCGTALSSHELAQGYADVKDLSVTAEFRLKDKPETSMLAWTTTPWTLPGNVGLAVGPDIDYVEIEKHDEGTGPLVRFILAKDRLAVVFKESTFKIVREMKGRELVGLEYEPLYPFIRDNISGPEKEKLSNAYRVYAADFVTTTDGTGIVHTAVMYGQDDFELGTQVGLPKYHLVNDDGTFKAEAGFLAGAFVKDEGTEVAIIKDLAGRGLLFAKEKYAHSYPHCWRCKTPLIYFARDSWYIRMSDLRKKLIKENEKISWEPEHIKEGRFGEWLREVKDWAISRERYWGTPLPVWQNDDGSERLVIGSIAELKRRIKRSGNTYLLLRHGECEANVEGISNSEKLDAYGLTEKGRDEVAARIKEIKKHGVDLIVASDFLRTKETARLVADALGIPERDIVYDERLREYDVGPEREGRSWRETEREVRNGKTFPGMETPQDVKKRTLAAMYDIDARYQGRRVLIVAHGAILNIIYHGTEGEASIDLIFHDSRRHFQHTGELREADFAPLPHDDDFNLDLHRPYIDRVVLVGDS